MGQIRIDKYLANSGLGTRSEIKKLMKNGLVKYRDEIIKNPSFKIEETEEVIVDGEKINYTPYIYLMMNKPKGYISATEDKINKTVIDLLEAEVLNYKPYPVGRLDIDTTGLLLLTNDGDFTHNLLSPKKNIKKVYLAQLDKKPSVEDIEAFKKGIFLENEAYTCKPALLEIIKDDTKPKARATISEGKYHQVKRMFQSCGLRVVELKREKIGELTLDQNLEPGQYRQLTETEFKALFE